MTRLALILCLALACGGHEDDLGPFDHVVHVRLSTGLTCGNCHVMHEYADGPTSKLPADFDCATCH
jgi:hypothetical protein